MDKKEYYQTIENALVLDRGLFDLSSEANIDRLEDTLNDYSKKHGEIVIGVPLVQPYGGPVCRYIALPESKYKQMRKAMEIGEVSHVHLEVGVPYDKKRFDINREQIKEGFKIPLEYVKFMEKIRKRARKVEVYKKPVFSFYP